jgi:hypothetical protein
VALWGKIHGEERDYIVVQASRIGTTIEKQYFFSSDDGVSFSKLPAVDQWAREQARTIRDRFSGNPVTHFTSASSAIAVDVKSDKKEERFADAKQAARVEEAARVLTELERLSAVVDDIEADTCVVPYGAYYRSSAGQVVENVEFSGLPLGADTDLSNFKLFRAPRDPRVEIEARKNRSVNTFDAFDSLPSDNSWIVRADESGLNLSLRSIAWHGFEGRVNLLSTSYSRGYFGDGLRNPDAAFML